VNGKQKFVVVIIFWIVSLSIWLVSRNSTSNAFSYLKVMKLERVELLEQFDDIGEPPKKSSSSAELLGLIDKCLDSIEQIPDFRFGEELSWKKVSFVSKEQVHNIGYAYLNNGDVVLGSFYKVEYSSGEIGVVGMGKGMKSSCLGKLLEKI